MDDKKYPGRFTIAFNLDDERQRAASEELRRHGRRKARFLADAILYYSQGQGTQAGVGAPVDDIVKRCVAAVLQSLGGDVAQQQLEAVPAAQKTSETVASGQQWKSEDLSVIAGALSAFQK